MLSQSIHAVLAECARGSVTQVTELLDTSLNEDELAAVGAARWLAGIDAAPPRPLDIGGEAADLYAFAAIITRDDGALETALQLHQGSSRRRQGRALWLRLEHGFDADEWTLRGQLEVGARKAGDAELVVELTSLHALMSLRQGELVNAIAVGRRASRMARAEGIPRQEYLANVILARVRRATQHPHRALRILSALRRVVPPAFRDWIDSEYVLSGGEGETMGATAELWARCVDSAGAGLLNEFDAALIALESHRSSWQTRRDARNFRVLFDPRFQETGKKTGEAQAWRECKVEASPSGIQAAASRPGVTESLAYVVLDPDGRAFRICSPGLCLLPKPGALVLNAKGSSTLALALPVLAAAAELGMEESEFFAKVYGFPYRGDLHKNAMKLLRRRVRAALPGEAELRVGDGRVQLSTTRTLAVADARCERPLEDRLLRFVAQRKNIPARVAAESLGIPLRSVQRTLEELVQAGDLQREGAGPTTTYGVEDTTFQEPTKR